MLNNDQALRAGRQKRSIHKFVDDDTVTASFVVQTAAAIYFDIPVGKQVVIKTINYGIETANKMVDVYIVGCDAVAGGGTPTQCMHHWHLANGANNQGALNRVQTLDVPCILRYSDGHRSVSLAVKATDTNAVVTYGWCGWVEDEGTLS